MATGTFDLIHPGHGYYLSESKKLGGDDARLVVVVARESTVRARKRVPIVPEKQRMKVVQMLKMVDEAVLGSETDMFSTVRKIKPDIITIGPDQKFDLDWLRGELEKRDIHAEVVKINGYHKSSLDSSCKIIKKIKESDFPPGSFKHC
ncbi:FAD synthase [Methanobacterium ferruginis]|uniref:FAD synthase n=1 Tax=Methanobacterium ferruginis TaxID=710191 RepID=UPI0025746D27|nr:FAD synthase [Methanobacterium ferruginis]MCC7550233.1 FAD synthase [Methanobacterium sp.]BDZ68301.1 FAD synthase [Methanobacterium ferruginis]